MNNSNNRNNNSNNNRRRGRGNNNSRPNGGQQINRIDSRARGNAPQMLEKYRKMALDSHMNGDRVNEEYYLQFADHYFRVIADTRVRQDETRQRRDERWDGTGEPGGEREFGDYGSEDAADPYDDLRQGGGDMRAAQDTRQNQDPRQGGERGDTRQSGERQGDTRQVGERQERFERQDRPERQDQRGERQDQRADRSERTDQRTERAEGQDRDRSERAPRRERTERQDRAPQQPVSAVSDQGEQPIETPSIEAERSVYEPPENPFVRGEGRGGLKQRRPRRETRDENAAEPVAATSGQDDAGGNSADVDQPSALDVFDPAILPPAVVTRRAPEPETAEVSAEAEGDAKPRRRTGRPRPAADGSDEPLQVAS